MTDFPPPPSLDVGQNACKILQPTFPVAISREQVDGAEDWIQNNRVIATMRLITEKNHERLYYGEGMPNLLQFAATTSYTFYFQTMETAALFKLFCGGAA